MRVGQLRSQVQPKVGVVLDVAIAEVDEQTTRLKTMIIIYNNNNFLLACSTFLIVGPNGGFMHLRQATDNSYFKCSQDMRNKTPMLGNQINNYCLFILGNVYNYYYYTRDPERSSRVDKY